MTRENDISTEKKIQKKSSWIQKKNEYKRRQKSFSCKKIKRKKEIVSLGHIICGLSS
ncbi:50S ribosomal protein L34 [Lachnospiraceae bacterium 3-1]|nr:50S ribosomal protein L34 [Lachnospiraceae bacterium 3-1]